MERMEGPTEGLEERKILEHVLAYLGSEAQLYEGYETVQGRGTINEAILRVRACQRQRGPFSAPSRSEAPRV